MCRLNMSGWIKCAAFSVLLLQVFAYEMRSNILVKNVRNVRQVIISVKFWYYRSLQIFFECVFSVDAMHKVGIKF